MLSAAIGVTAAFSLTPGLGGILLAIGLWLYLSTDAVAVHYVDPSGIGHDLTDAHNVFLNLGAAAQGGNARPSANGPLAQSVEQLTFNQ